MFNSWTKFLTLLQNPLVRSGANKMKRRKQRKRNKRTSTSGFLVHRENTNRMSLYIWLRVAWMLEGVSRRKVQQRSVLSEWAKSSLLHSSHQRLRATVVMAIGAISLLWKQHFCISYLGFGMIHLPPCCEGLGEVLKGICLNSPSHPSPLHPNKLLTVYTKLAVTASTFHLLNCSLQSLPKVRKSHH